MLAQVMEVWHGVVIAVVSLILQACLLAVINYLLSRHMAKEIERILKAARSQAPSFSPTHCCPPAAKERKETRAERNVLVPEPRYRHDSDTSSDSSDSSNSSPPTTSQVTKDVNYTQVVFAAPGDRRNDSVLDYENIKEATDYVNVNPKSHKPDFWTFVNPAVSEPVEYTQVVM
ncbi:regulator of hemoglobinization and erythroid cell expansion protein isoform X1 [Bubalus bubalis]|uniref:regulator of hemoglobinization and erythroid cell expansion protein isoform X1 n=2 Tax=Bubalus bubalis TaxID=89462 RepID=UPI00042CADE8|nr:regulator of hemoglobinization and erythroid cell expansion protein isoform X1 [Bubalus bubalis]